MDNLLSIIGVLAMLTIKMLILNVIRCGLYLRIDAACLECLDDDDTGVLLICLIDLLSCQISGAGDRSKKIVCVGRAIQRNISACLCPQPLALRQILFAKHFSR